MGCIKSKQTYSLQNNVPVEKKHENGERWGEEKVALAQSTPEDMKADSLPTNLLLLDYAHRLSAEIVDKAVKQWAETDNKYSDIPYIESDIP